MQSCPDPCISHLDNGLTVASQAMPGIRSASLGVWVRAGSRDEAEHQHGMAHFWEHMVFKGTARRSLFDIARELDRLGGLSNAYTAREETCYFVRVVDERLPEAVDILSDIVLHPLLTDEDLAMEKQVVLQEIAMVADSPEEQLFESFWERLWDEPGVAHPILGTPETVGAFTEPELHRFKAERYQAANILVASCGAVDHDNLVELAQHAFGALSPGAPRSPYPTPEPSRPFFALERDCEQSHVLLSFPSVSMTHEGRFARVCLSALAGGQMSSRLFQEVREKRGLAYNVYSQPHSLSDCGVMQVYAATSPARTTELIEVLCAELGRMAAGDITAEELEHAREHLTGLLYLGAESSEERMTRLAKNLMLFGRHIDYDETAARIHAVTLDEVRACAAETFVLDAAALGVAAPRVDPAWAEPFGASFSPVPGGGK